MGQRCLPFVGGELVQGTEKKEGMGGNTGQLILMLTIWKKGGDER